MRWGAKWGMEFQIPKCKVMHVQYRSENPKSQTHHAWPGVGGDRRGERHIGVMVTKNIKPVQQGGRAARTARGVLGPIQNSFHYGDKVTFKKLYVLQYVRPHKGFAETAWASWTAEDKEVIEKGTPSSSEDDFRTEKEIIRGEMQRDRTVWTAWREGERM